MSGHGYFVCYVVLLNVGRLPSVVNFVSDSASIPVKPWWKESLHEQHRELFYEHCPA